MSRLKNRMTLTPEQKAYVDAVDDQIRQVRLAVNKALRHIKGAARIPFPAGIKMQDMQQESVVLGLVEKGLQDTANLFKNL